MICLSVATRRAEQVPYVAAFGFWQRHRGVRNIYQECVCCFFCVCVWKLDRRRKTERTGSRTKFPSTCPPYTMMRLCRRRRWRQRRRCRRLLYATAPACTPSTASMFGVRNHVENMSCGHAPVPQSRHRSKFLGERLSVLACLRHAENSAERAA